MKAPMAGWISFAAIMMLVIGSLTFFEGLIAVIRKEYYVVTGNGVLVFDLTTWGWIMIFWGILLVLVGLALFGGSLWARWFTVALASLNIIGQLGFLGSTQYPLWTLTLMALNIIVIYALVIHWEGYQDVSGPDRGDLRSGVREQMPAARR
jgi:hypothetical protein